MKKILLLLLFCFLFSCEKKEPNFSEDMIEKLSVMQEYKDGELLPSIYLGLDLYGLTKNNEVCKTNNHELFFFYKEYYFKKFKSFEDFLSAVLNKNFVLDKELFKKRIYLASFKLNPVIQKEYSDLGFDKFLKKYSKPSIRKDELELNKSVIKTGGYSTIKYFLFLNRYDVSVDCYIGKDYISKREDAFK
ncbi:hypothetical protein [Flavobacterium sp. RS13.1]|uniref:hypothetical protein n=1 Tax=Flavobacterium sp. RS13.1 TaxID=3400345 RepID=UPI003AABB07A